VLSHRGGSSSTLSRRKPDTGSAGDGTIFGLSRSAI
jgi:hypothetical protein